MRFFPPGSAFHQPAERRHSSPLRPRKFTMFKALMLEEKDGKVTSSIQDVDEARLPEGDVTVAVSHSTLNYKDGLILLGQGRLVRQYPHIPGVDFAGTVIESAHPAYKP